MIKRPFTARLLPPDSVYMRFDYYNKLRGFRLEKPVWPKSTKAVSKTTVQLEFKSKYSILENQIINLELIDYRGEWIMDLSMLDLSFQEWSQNIIELSHEEKRVKYSQSWLNLLTTCTDRERLSEEYTEYLKNLYYNNFSFIQPGRFIEPSDMKGDPLLEFCPLPSDFKDREIYDSFKLNYDRYLKEVVERLYLEHFKYFDTQIILVDLIKTLNHGEEIFDDMHLAFKNILKTFTYGSNNFISKFFTLKIDHVLFAATKADHIPASSHQSYKKLLEELIWDIKNSLDVSHIESEVTIFSSVKSTQFVKAKLEGIEVDCVRGIVEGESEPSTHFGGILPKDYKDENFWDDGEFEFVSFKPISFPKSDRSAIEHIRMDRIIYTLLRKHV
jgi:predicted YcjX-like family ATPase